MNTIWRLVQVLAVVAVFLLAPAVAQAQDSKSTALAGELAKLLDSAKLESIAAKHGANGFVGALYFPGSQLLVVSGTFAAPERALVLLGQKSYRDIYIDLNSASVPATKVFISDLGANGLKFKRERSQPIDTVDMAGKSYSFDGDWKKAKITEAEYTRAFQTSDEQYQQMLQALLDQLKKAS